MSDHAQEESIIIETTDQEGNVHLWEKVDEIDMEDKRYALLIYQGSGEEGKDGIEGTDEDEDGYDERVFLMRIGEEDGAEVFEQIEDKEEFDKVIAYIEQLGEYDLDMEEDVDQEAEGSSCSVDGDNNDIDACSIKPSSPTA
jgi:hypothetical protein